MKRPKHKDKTRLGASKYQELTVITKPVPYAISPIVLGIFHEDIPRTTIPLQQHAEPEEAVTLAVSAQIALGLNRTTQVGNLGQSRSEAVGINREQQVSDHFSFQFYVVLL